MSISKAHTNPNTSSDFSIEKILSDDSKSRSNCLSAPGWVGCTRYQPPRIPRAAGASRARRSGRHARVPFTGAQAAALEAAYARSPYLAPPALRALAAALQLRDDRIKIWFQNRRARERREKTFINGPANAVTLPSTMRGHLYDSCMSTESPDGTNQSLSFGNTSGDSDIVRDVSGSSSCYVWRSVSSSEEDSITSLSRSESPLDVETVVD